MPKASLASDSAVSKPFLAHSTDVAENCKRVFCSKAFPKNQRNVGNEHDYKSSKKPFELFNGSNQPAKSEVAEQCVNRETDLIHLPIVSPDQIYYG